MSIIKREELIYEAYLFCQKGDEGANDYGKPVS